MPKTVEALWDINMMEKAISIIDGEGCKTAPGDNFKEHYNNLKGFAQSIFNIKCEEGKIVKLDVDKYGEYKGDEGKLHMVDILVIFYIFSEYNELSN